MESEIEITNLKVILACKISEEDCTRLNLGYLNLAKIKTDEWKYREMKVIFSVLNFVSIEKATLTKIKRFLNTQGKLSLVNWIVLTFINPLVAIGSMF